MGRRLVATGVAARELGIDTRTLQRWAAARLVTPTLVTAGGHLRWNIDDLLQQLTALREQSGTDR